MMQKDKLFKGQCIKKTLPINCHGNAPSPRKGKRLKKPSNITKDMETNRLTLSHPMCNQITTKVTNIVSPQLTTSLYLYVFHGMSNSLLCWLTEGYILS
ncbi:hypothetical protein AMTRI_Chr09g21490 [Amborella trichopoda]